MFRSSAQRILLPCLTVIAGQSAVAQTSSNPNAITSPPIFINEIHYDNVGTDSDELVEIAGPAGTDLTGWHIVLYNGKNGKFYRKNNFSDSISDDTGSGFGFSTIMYDPKKGIQNGGKDPDGLALVDDKGSVIQFLSYEGTFKAVNGPAKGMTSTDIGVLESQNTPKGQSLQLSGTGKTYVDFTWQKPAANTQGTVNTGQKFSNNTSSGAMTLIHAIQGKTDANAMDGKTVTIEGIVTGDFQDKDSDKSRNLQGFYVQEEDSDNDSDPLTSEGIFVYEAKTTLQDVNVGDKVQVTGTVGEYFNETQLKNITKVMIVNKSNPLPKAASIKLPAAKTTKSLAGKIQPDLEAYEGMLVTFPDTLSISEMYQLARFNEIKLSQGGRLEHFTQKNKPDAASYAAHLESLGARTITYDDGLYKQNTKIANLDGFGPTFTTASDIRMGDTITNLSGVLSYQWAGNKSSQATWRVRSTKNGENTFVKVNKRQASPPKLDGSLKVASFNVENYFTSIDDKTAKCGPPSNKQQCRGADTAAEFDRQRAKTVTAISLIDADIIGLMELENTDDTAITNLVNGLNDKMGANTYAYVNSGHVGLDAIRVGLIYKPAKVSLVGKHAILDSSVDANFIDTKNRPVLAQTFKETATGEQVTIAIVHLKSKGSSCDSLGDPNKNDGQANCNQTRTKAAKALKNWLAKDPTKSNAKNFLLLGDFNSYAMEDPITALEENGDYTNLIKQLAKKRMKHTNLESAEFSARRYVFDAQLGTLDYAFANAALLPKITGAEEWHINADEPSAIDYNLDYGRDAGMFDGTVPYRTSDHDPILVGLQLMTTYAVTVNTEHGNVETIDNTIDLQKVLRDSVVTFNLTPDADYQISSITGCGGTLSPDKTTFKTAAMTANCTIDATFSPINDVVKSMKFKHINGSKEGSLSVSGGGNTCQLESVVSVKAENLPGSPDVPNGVEFTQGLVELTAKACDKGSAVQITIEYPEEIAAGSKLMKWGKTTTQPQDHWYEMNASFNGRTVTYTIIDGGLGDDDLTANGIIVDPAGPASPIQVPPVNNKDTKVQSVPMLSRELLLAMIVLLGYLTFYRTRKIKAN